MAVCARAAPHAKSHSVAASSTGVRTFRISASISVRGYGTSLAAALARSREHQRHVVKLADNLVLFYPAPKTPGLGFPRDVAPGQRRAADREGFSVLRALDFNLLVILMDAQPKIAALPNAARLGRHDPQVKRALVALPVMRLCHAHGLRAVGLPARHCKSVRDDARAGPQLVDKARLQPV